MDDSDAPIISNGRHIFHANPKAVFYRPYITETAIFSIDNKYLKRIFLDRFASIGHLEGHLFFKNDTCEIFVPLFNGKQLMLDPVIKSINEGSKITCKISVEDLTYGYKIIKEIAELNNMAEVTLDISPDGFYLQLLDSSFSLLNYLLSEDATCKIKIPITHLQSIIKASFVNKNEYVILRLGLLASKLFVVQSNDLLFIGGVYRM